MFRHFLGVATLALSLVTGSALAQPALQDFTLLNMTGGTIERVYVSASQYDLWGRDVLGRGVLMHGDSTRVRFPPSNDVCGYDIKVAYAGGEEVQWEGVNLCAISIVGLFYDPGSGRTWATAE